MTAVNPGVVREVWLASLDAPNSKYSFLIRDDAFSKSGAIFGRTTRLGDPVSTGPGSGWRQLTWEGGSLQRQWSDAAMFEEGSADVWSHLGRVRMWPGWGHIQKDATRKFDSYSLGRGNVGPALGNTSLFLAERNRFYTGGAPSGGFKAYRYTPDNNSMTTLATTPTTLGNRGYTAICPATDDGSSASYIYFGTSGGLWLLKESDNSWYQDTNAPATGVEFDSMVPFRDALYFCSGKSLYKRTPLAPYGVLGTHTQLKEHKSAYVCNGLTVWNNRLWYGIQYQGNRFSLGTSDGVTANQVLEFPEEFVCLQMVAHYGALYIVGLRPQAVTGTKSAPSGVAQVWRYTGSSLSKLWESNDEDLSAYTDGVPHLAGGACSFGSLLVWTNSGFLGTCTPRSGLMCYDAEKDAIFEGPPLPQDRAGQTDGMSIMSVYPWNNTLAVSYHDFHDYTKQGSSGVDWCTGVSYLRWPNRMRSKTIRSNIAATFKGRSVDAVEQKRMQYVLSSRYRGDDSWAAETKTWLAGRVVVRIQHPGALLRVYLVTNERESYLVQTIRYDASDTGWRTVAFQLKHPGSYSVFGRDGSVSLTLESSKTGQYLQSQQVQYRVELVNTDYGNTASQATPEVDSIEILWQPAPTKRRQWHLRFLCQDVQLRLDGTPNPLGDAQSQADKLEDFWSANLPFRMWGPFADSMNPNNLNATNCVEVTPVVESYQNVAYRVVSNDSEVMQEVGLTLIENPAFT